MKVLVLHSELGALRGGGENFTRNLFAAFSERGHQVAAAFVANRSGEYKFSLPPGIEPIPIKGWWRRQLGLAVLASIGTWMPSQGKRPWDRIYGGITWRVQQWHEGRFRRRIDQDFNCRWTEFDS
jgi:hypothetical protein